MSIRKKSIQSPKDGSAKTNALIAEAHQYALYELYLKLFAIVKRCPDLFPAMRLTTVFTAIMGSQPWGWRVVGISKNAMREYRKVNYKHPARLLHRGHMKMRADTAKKFFLRDEPFPQKEFFETYINGDKTLIMTAEENRSGAIPADYIRIRNPKGELFRNSAIGWRHSKSESEYLRSVDIRKRKRN